MKRGFLGTAEVTTYEYWSGGKSSHELKCNETILYSEIDLCQSYAQYCKTAEKLQEQYSKMDEMYMCIKAVEFCGSDDELLRCAGAIIGNMKTEGCFSIAFDNIEDENRYLDGLVEELREKLSPENDTMVSVTNTEFDEWFDENVVAYNYYQTPNGRFKEMPQMLGATSTGNDDYTSRMKDSAMSLLYYGADKNLLYDGCTSRDEMNAKIYSSGKAVGWFASKGTNMTEKSINNAIQSGIIENTEGLSQTEAIEKFKRQSAGLEGLGDGGVTAIITLVIMAISAIAGLITSIAKIVQSVRTDDIPDYEEEPDPPSFAPDKADFENMKAELEKQTGLSTTELIAVVGVAGVGLIGALIMMFGKKEKRND